MISTVTTTTVTGTLTHTAIFGAIGITVLISLLVAKELLNASTNSRALFLGKISLVAIYPLLFAFLTIMVLKVLEAI